MIQSTLREEVLTMTDESPNVLPKQDIENKREENVTEPESQATPRWSDDTTAVFEDGTKISISNACFYCSVSLQYCHCHLIGRVPLAIHPNGKTGYSEVTLRVG